MHKVAYLLGHVCVEHAEMKYRANVNKMYGRQGVMSFSVGDPQVKKSVAGGELCKHTVR